MSWILVIPNGLHRDYSLLTRSFRPRTGKWLLAASFGLVVALGWTARVEGANGATWLGGTSNSWKTAGNWQGGVPANNDPVLFLNNPANQPTVDAAGKADGSTFSAT